MTGGTRGRRHSGGFGLDSLEAWLRAASSGLAHLSVGLVMLAALMTRILQKPEPTSRAAAVVSLATIAVISVAFGVALLHTLLRLRRPDAVGRRKSSAPVRGLVALLAICFTPVVWALSVAVVGRLIADAPYEAPVRPSPPSQRLNAAGGRDVRMVSELRGTAA